MPRYLSSSKRSAVNAAWSLPMRISETSASPSPSGDKKAQRFEDGYTDLLCCRRSNGFGFNAVTYMPSRNTEEQLRGIMELCDAHKLFQISGEDINSPRQSFLCHAMKADMFSHLSDAAYALIGYGVREKRQRTLEPVRCFRRQSAAGYAESA